MGGRGSGRWRGESGRQTTEDFIGLDVRTLKREGSIGPAQQQIEGVARLVWTECNFGGSRPWFVCPGDHCGRRAAILYGEEGRWLCRSCRDLAYTSQRDRPVTRARKRAEKARRRLAPDEHNPRPKGMHHTTFVRLGREYVRAHQEHVARYEEWMAKLSEQYARRPPGVPPS